MGLRLNRSRFLDRHVAAAPRDDEKGTSEPGYFAQQIKIVPVHRLRKLIRISEVLSWGLIDFTAQMSENQ